MKKIYSALAMAALVSASAFAAPFQKEANLGNISAQNLSGLEMIQEVSGSMEKTAPAKAAQMSDFLGFMAVEGTWPFQQSSDPGTSVMIQQIEGNTVALTFSPWHKYTNVNIDPIVATVNTAAGTITINTAANANLGTADLTEGTVSVCWAAYKLESDGAGGTKRTPLTQMVGTLQSDGSITFGGINELCGFGIVGKDSWLGAWRDLKFTAPDYFRYVESEWESAGTASYQEYIINPLLTQPIGAVDCPVERKKDNSGFYLLRRPYAYGNWTQVNEVPSSDGFIVFNIGTPECVWLRPLTPSGFWTELGEDYIGEFYIYNLEGDYLFNDAELDPADVAAVFEEEGTPCSTYDPATGKVEVVNVLFGDTEDPGAGYTWVNYKNLTMNITLPTGGVNDILNDAAAAAPRYFNLQGLEIAKPAAGEVVIVKEGKKTYKQIVK
ncbi:MAG: hypothetical protein K2N88_05815 [Muribaculaceae bacterium]|nr:hypothetical protein [Muribaculaceae bacterium]